VSTATARGELTGQRSPFFKTGAPSAADAVRVMVKKRTKRRDATFIGSPFVKAKSGDTIETYVNDVNAK
jgi:hypothetical protein